LSQIFTDHWLDGEKCLKCGGIMQKIQAGRYRCICGFKEDNY